MQTRRTLFIIKHRNKNEECGKILALLVCVLIRLHLLLGCAAGAGALACLLYLLSLKAFIFGWYHMLDCILYF